VADSQLTTMKFAIGIIVFFWLLSGVIGAWMLGDLNSRNWKVVARGPIALADAWNEHGVTIPGP
jgi:hypothetical protein